MINIDKEKLQYDPMLGSFRNIQFSSYFFDIFKTYIFKEKPTTRV